MSLSQNPLDIVTVARGGGARGDNTDASIRFAHNLRVCCVFALSPIPTVRSIGRERRTAVVLLAVARDPTTSFPRPEGDAIGAYKQLDGADGDERPSLLRQSKATANGGLVGSFLVQSATRFARKNQKVRS